nr:unnamed protein product [Timema californicum]
MRSCVPQEWNDYNLRWNESEFGGVKDLRITPNKIWRPDILMYNRYHVMCYVTTPFVVPRPMSNKCFGEQGNHF